MPNSMIFREMEKGEEKDVSELVKEVFDEFVAPDFSPEGINTFLTFIAPDSLIQRNHVDPKNFVITANDNGRIVGIIEIRDYNHICLLFVDKKYHQKGIAKKLYEISLQRCKNANPGLHEFEVNASRFAVPIYEKLGFQKSCEEQIKDGIIFTPMKAKV